jgi:hypothetical protein
MEGLIMMKKILAAVIFFILFTPFFSARDNAATLNDSSDTPSFFSWRNIDGIDYTTPIKDQSPAPTCEAYALCAALETLLQYQQGELYNPDLSETHLYFYPGGTYEAGYVNLIDAADYLIEKGVPDEGCYPDPHRPYDYPFQSLSDWENRTVKIMAWRWVEHDVDIIKQSLIDDGPLIICLYFGTDFYYYLGGVYTHRWGRIAGGHVVTIVGYDDADQCWIVKNSWGSKWGEDGWFRLAYDADLFADWYGEGTGIMSLQGVYGNMKPDVPKVQIVTPKNYYTYYNGRETPTLFRRLPIQEAAPRILGDILVDVSVESTNYVEFYVDDIKQYTDTEPPFSWPLEVHKGLHTLEVRAINDNTTSIDLIDVFIL